MSEHITSVKQTSPMPDGVERAAARPVFRPRVDILEFPEEIVLLADIPGADEAATDVSLDKNVLTIRAAVRAAGPAGYTLAAAEYEIGDFERAFTLSEEIDRQRIDAQVKDGVLRIRLPKLQDTGSRKIHVHAG